PTKVSSKLPNDLQEKLTTFYENINQSRRNNNFDLSCIANLDETSIFLICVIPTGFIFIVQPLDVSINKPFKESLRNKWRIWMTAGNHKFTKKRNMKKPEHDLMYHWIMEAWSDISPETIIKSFKKCGISNALDGSENELIRRDKDNNEHIFVIFNNENENSE
ncbi:27787_t:CDS:2, partial [Racocetra persica]